MSSENSKTFPAALTSNESREFLAFEPNASPDGMKVLMEREARAHEQARTKLLHLFDTHGYQLIEPPIVDSIEMLTSIATPKLRQKLLSTIDPENSRPLGLRIDITPQIARLDARQMDHSTPQRYAYCGHVLHGVRDHLGSIRNPCQIGVELFGAQSIAADLEIVSLALDSCALMSLDKLVIDFGHLGIYDQLFHHSKLHRSLHEPLFLLLQTKSHSEVENFLKNYQVAPPIRQLFAQVIDLHGGRETLDVARQQLDFAPQISEYLDTLVKISAKVEQHPAVDRVIFDLAYFNGYGYESGMVFQIYNTSPAVELIRGGRYNNIGSHYGRGRGAVGFSGYLHHLISRSQDAEPDPKIYAPYRPDDLSLQEAVQQLRQNSSRVVCGLSAEDDEGYLGCLYTLHEEKGRWRVMAVEA